MTPPPSPSSRQWLMLLQAQTHISFWRNVLFTPLLTLADSLQGPRSLNGAGVHPE